MSVKHMRNQSRAQLTAGLVTPVSASLGRLFPEYYESAKLSPEIKTEEQCSGFPLFVAIHRVI